MNLTPMDNITQNTNESYFSGSFSGHSFVAASYRGCIIDSLKLNSYAKRKLFKKVKPSRTSLKYEGTITNQ